MKKEKFYSNYEEKYLLDELMQSRNALAAAYSCFENATEPDLIDSCIYQVNSAQKRYTFLLNRAKEANIAVTCQLACEDKLY